MEIDRDEDEPKKNLGKRKETDDDSGGVLEGQKKPKSMKSSNPAPEIPQKFKNCIRQMGFSEPFLAMQRTLDDSLFEKHRHFFLMPLEVVNQSGILTDKQKQFLDENRYKYIEATLIGSSLSLCGVYVKRWDNFHYALKLGRKQFEQDHELSPGDQFQLWSFNKNGSELGFALVQVDNSNLQVQELNQPPKIPEEIEHRITGSGGKGIAFVMEKTLLSTDVRGSKRCCSKRCYIPLEKIENQFFSDEEKEKILELYQDEGINAVLIGPSTDHEDREFNIRLRKRGAYYFLGQGWMDFVEKYGLEVGNKLLIWSFRRPCANTNPQIGMCPSEIGFALALVNEKQV